MDAERSEIGVSYSKHEAGRGQPHTLEKMSSQELTYRYMNIDISTSSSSAASEEKMLLKERMDDGQLTYYKYWIIIK